MHVDLWEAAFDVVQQLLVPVEFVLGVQAALHQDLVAAQSDRLLDLVEQLLAGQHVSLFMAGPPIEGAEIADRRADVGVVDVAVDVVSAVLLGM